MKNIPTLHTHSGYRPDIDGLRAVAVLSVVLFHAFPKAMTGGFVGVDIFFVISGFLISSIIFQSLAREQFSFADFYARRVRRIFPALIFVLICCLAFGWLSLLSGELNQLGVHIAAGATFVSNILLWSEVGYFDVTAESKPLLHLWSLGIEEQFYIIWPVLIWAIWKSQRFVPLFLLCCIIASFSLGAYLTSSNPTAAFYSPLSRFWELLCGALLAWQTLYGRVPKSRWGSSLGSAFGLSIIGLSFWYIDGDSSFPGYWALLPVIGAVLIIRASPAAAPNRILLSNKVVVWFGIISFPLYLWHWPIFSFAKIVYEDNLPRYFEPLALLLSVLLAWLTVRVIEKPFRHSNFALRGKTIALVGAMFVLGLAAFAVGRSDFIQSHTVENLTISRKESHAIGPSIKWYRGKDDWLFLGNAYNNTVAKLKLSAPPPSNDLDDLIDLFSSISREAARSGTKVVLIVGPNKSTIYPEYLPEELTPSASRYTDPFLDRLSSIPNLTVYDPTHDFINLKNQEGLLYWRTDTHWNPKGAFFALRGALEALKLPAPAVQFRQGEAYSGDLIGISELENFPLYPDDSWEAVWPQPPQWQVISESGTSSTFGSIEVVENPKAQADMSVWVVGDSFTSGLRPYINSVFKEVNYIGHWSEKLKSLTYEIERAEKKPDIIFIIKVERSF